MRKPNKIRYDLQSEIDKVINELLTDTGQSIGNYRAYIVNQRRGRASYRRGFFTVPLWAFDRRYKDNYRGAEGYFKYYVAHELSHILRYIKYNDHGVHDYRFYEIFMRLCPTDLQHLELNYLPTSSKYGICEKENLI